MATLTQTFARKLEHTYWMTALYAALVAGATFLVLQMLIAGLLQGYDPFLPLRMIAAIALGPGVLWEGVAPFTVLVVAFVLHFCLSAMTAWIVAPVVQDMSPARAVLTGAIAGLVIYVVNFYLLSRGFTWFQGIRGWPTLANHLIFGAVLARTYQNRRRHLA